MTQRLLTDAEWRAVDSAFRQRDDFARAHGVTGDDFDKMQEESEAFIKRVGELEDEITPALSEADFADKLSRWSKNWIEIIKRRVLARQKEGTK